MKIIYVNCGWRNEYGSGPRSYEHYLSSSENKEVMGSNPLQAWIFFRALFSLLK